MGLFNLFKSSKTTLVIDGLSLNEALGQKGNIAPRVQLQVLRRLSRFSEREKLDMVVVLSGTPLNKAPAGKKFEGITVVYSKSPAAHVKYLVATTGKKGAGAVLVSGNAEAEKQAGSRVMKLSMSTFRKAFDIGGNDFDSNERSSGGNRNRPQRRRGKKEAPAAPAEKEDRPEKPMSDEDAINELIDLID